jgi:hypothetical protein
MKKLLMDYLTKVSEKEEVVSLVTEYNKSLASKETEIRKHIENQILPYIQNDELSTEFGKYLLSMVSPNYCETIEEVLSPTVNFTSSKAEPFGTVFSLFMLEVTNTIEDEKIKYFFLNSLTNESTDKVLDVLCQSDTYYAYSKNFLHSLGKEKRDLYYNEFYQLTR